MFYLLVNNENKITSIYERITAIKKHFSQKSYIIDEEAIKIV